MTDKDTVAGLEELVALLLRHADRMRGHIEAHEFDLAATEARALGLYCREANEMANRIADEVET